MASQEGDEDHEFEPDVIVADSGLLPMARSK